MPDTAAALTPPLDAAHPLAAGTTSESVLVRAARGERSSRLPIWFMRQAGRSLPEYRKAREGIGMLESCLQPDLAAEITLQPVRRHGVDGAVFFSDIVVPLKLLGEDVEIVPGRGPVFANPVRTPDEAHAFAARVRERIHPDLFAPITQAVRLTTAELGETPLIGFAGAPFTVAAYVVEGGPSKDHLRTRTLMQAAPDAWLALAGAIAELSGAFLEAQVRAGASVVQLFDSWAGSLSVERYRASVAPSSAIALERVRALRTPDGERIRTIHFGVGTGELLVDMHAIGADVQGVDDRIPLDEASRRLGGAVPLQGNIDPAALGAGFDVLQAHTADVVRRGFSAPAHIVNLGHGVPPEADPETLTRLVSFVHELRGDAPSDGTSGAASDAGDAAVSDAENTGGSATDEPGPPQP